MVYNAADMVYGSCKKIKCTFCNKAFSGSASHVEDHLLKCPNIDMATQSDIRTSSATKKQTKKAKVKAKKQNAILQERSQVTIEEMLGKDLSIKARLDSFVARFVFTGFHSFHIVDQPEFKEFVELLLLKGPPDYKLPSSAVLGTRLLDEQYEESKSKSKAMVEKAVVSSANTLVSDHVTDAAHVNLQSFCCVSPSAPPTLRS